MIQENTQLKYLILNLKWPLMIFLFFLICCKDNKSKDIKLVEILSDSLIINPLPSHVFVLSNGGCPQCNKMFHNFMLNVDHKNPKIAFIISNRGTQFDLSKFYSMEHVTFDYRELLIDNHIINSNSAYIKLDSNRIDTIINLNPKNINQSFQYIQKEVDRL